jgi:hypothetical protein
MDIAEDIGDAFSVEPYRPTGPRFIEAEIKAFAVEQREDVVKKRVLIGKFNLSSRGNDK